MITVKNLSKSFSGNVIFKDFSYEFKKGEITLIEGANGTGKSTLLNIISCLIKPDSGEIYFSNRKISFYDYKYRNQVGYLLDKPFYLEKLNAFEFLLFLLESYKFHTNKKSDVIKYYLRLFQLPPDILIENFSKGMKRKISIISALIHEPQYIIMDEPMASLDDRSIQILSNLLYEKKRTSTILISSPMGINYLMADSTIELKNFNTN